MRLLISAFLSFLFTGLLVHAGCPPSDKALLPITNFLEEKFHKDILSQGIGPDSTADLKWIQDNVIPHFLTEPLPKGFLQDVEKIREKCFRPDGLSTLAAQRAFKKCAGGQLPGFLSKYASVGIKACSMFEKDIIPQWETKYKLLTSVYFSKFCKAKGKRC